MSDLWDETGRLSKILEGLYADQRALARLLSETDVKIEIAKTNYKAAFDALQSSQINRKLVRA